MRAARKPYPSDASDAEWEFLAPYLTLRREDAPPRDYSPRDAFGGLRYAVKTGCRRDMRPRDFPPRAAVRQQARRWVAAGVFAGVARDPRVTRRLAAEREGRPTAATLDGRTPQSTPGGGGRAGYDGAKRRRGSKVRVAAGTLGNLLALKVTAAGEPERAQVAELAARVQGVTGGTVEAAFVDQGYAGASASDRAAGSGIRLGVVEHAEANRGFARLPRRWVAGRSFAWLGRFRRLARGDERLAAAVAGWHWLAFWTVLLPGPGLDSA
mgnify:CR=1 FL=1